MHLKNNFLRYLVIVLFILTIGMSLGYHQITPRRATHYKEKIMTLQEVNGDDAEFNMVMSHVYHMAKEAHPSGSEAIVKVQEYLEEQFAAIGCEYQIQEFEVDMSADIEQNLVSYNTYMDEHPKEKDSFEKYIKDKGFLTYEDKYRYDIGCIDTNVLPFVNYLVKVDAPNTDQGVIFVSHYDSTQGGPGVGDDLISVASMLETLREVNTKNNLRNDLYFLFTDGEELDLFGSDAFVKEYPNMKDKLKLVINLEARGNSGTLVMFQTSLQNKNIVKELNNALYHNSTMFSMTAAVYRLMPNDTDLTKFLEVGYPGINFAVIGSPENYHAATDNFENLDINSAYMYYNTVSKLANYFGKSDLNTLQSEEDAVYFPLIQGNTIVLSNHGMFLFSCIMSLITLLWIGFLFIKRESRIKNVLTSSAFLCLTLIGTFFIGIVGTFIYNIVWDPAKWIVMAGTLNIIFYIICFVTILFTIYITWMIAKRTSGSQTLLISTILIFNLLNLVCTLVFNSIAYIFTIPLSFLFLYSVVTYLIKKPISYIYILVQGVIVCLLYAPCIYMLYTALLSTIISVDMLLLGLSVIPIAVQSVTTVLYKKTIEDKTDELIQK